MTVAVGRPPVGVINRWGQPASVATEYSDHGIDLVRANNDREAGYVRLLELLHVDSKRIAPPWAQIREGVEGAPRLYVFATCRELIRQFKSAPIGVEGLDAGEAVDMKWESEHGHGVASARYGSMSRPSPSAVPDVPEGPPDNPAWSDEEWCRAEFRWRREKQWRERENELRQNWTFV